MKCYRVKLQIIRQVVTNCTVVFVHAPRRLRVPALLLSVSSLILHSVAAFVISRPVK